MNNWAKNIGVWLVIGVVLMLAFMSFSNRGQQRNVMDYSTMMQEAKAGNLDKVRMEGTRTARVFTRDNREFIASTPGDIFMWDDLRKAGVKIEAKPEEEQSMLLNILISSFPVLLLIAVWIYFMRQMQGGGKGSAT